VFDADVVLPPESVLLHIGPHKTGTSALQSAFHSSRKRLRKQGIRYTGRARQPMRAAIAVSQGRGAHGKDEPEMDLWERLVKEVDGARDRKVVVSSEFFCEADDAAARRIVSELGGDRVHVVVTLRPLSGIFPSQWQQYVQNGLRLTYDEWLEKMLNEPPGGPPSPNFWLRHDHGELVERWVQIVGGDRLVVVVPDERDRGSLLRTFESILGLEAGFLVPESHRTNRSLSLGEVDLVRRLNIEFKKRDWMGQEYHNLMRLGVIWQLLQGEVSGIDEPRMTTPRWAIEAISAAGAASAKRIAASGARVIGDLSVLGAAPSSPDAIRENDEPMPYLPPSSATAVEAVMGAIVGSGYAGSAKERPVGPTVAQSSARDLATELKNRALDRVRPSSTR
jgi:hypothetical protein